MTNSFHLRKRCTEMTAGFSSQMSPYQLAFSLFITVSKKSRKDSSIYTARITQNYKYPEKQTELTAQETVERQRLLSVFSESKGRTVFP